MKITTFSPDQYISRYVKGIFVIENSHNHQDFTLPLFANGSPTLVFHSGKLTVGNKINSPLVLYGQTIDPGQLNIMGEFTLIAYYFYPQALNSLFHIQASELTNGYLDMNFQKEARAIRLQEQLLNTPLLPNRLSILTNFVRARF